MKIATLTDHYFSPSSRFRIRQYIPNLRLKGFEIYDYSRKYSIETASSRDSNKRIRESYKLILNALLHESANLIQKFYQSLQSHKYDVVWLSRQMIIGYPSFEYLIKKPMIYDIDDAIFLTNKLSNIQYKITSKRANAIIAGNEYLANESLKYNNNVFVIPTAVDTQRWKPVLLKENKLKSKYNDYIIGWSGTSSSFKYFLPIEQSIRKLLIDFPRTKLVFMSDKFPKELKVLGPYIKFVKWSIEMEVKFIQSLDLGLMPVANDDWSKGKCAYKALLYSACGIPVVMTPTGVNQKLLEQSNIGFGPRTPNEWYEVIEMLLSSQSLGGQLGENGVDLVRKNYSLEVCTPKLVEIFNKFV